MTDKPESALTDLAISAAFEGAGPAYRKVRGIKPPKPRISLPRVSTGINRGAAVRSAGRYVAGKAAKVGTLARMARAAGTVGGFAGRTALKSANPAFAIASTGYEIGRTAYGIHQLHKEKQKIKGIEAGTRGIEAEMQKKHPEKYKAWKAKQR